MTKFRSHNISKFAICAWSNHAESGTAGAWAAGVALVSLVLGTALATDRPRGSLVEQVRAANDRFKDLSVAMSEGYMPIPCASGTDSGTMGIHLVNAGLISDTPADIKRPQAVMYEPMPDGKLSLVAVEYITTKGPASLLGQLFNFNGAPNRYDLGPFYQLHVWAWKANPHGAFADMNPRVTCEHALTE